MSAEQKEIALTAAIRDWAKQPGGPTGASIGTVLAVLSCAIKDAKAPTASLAGVLVDGLDDLAVWIEDEAEPAFEVEPRRVDCGGQLDAATIHAEAERVGALRLAL